MPIDIEALLQPISASQPCGAEIRNHPLFIQIREARRQEENLSQGVWAHDVKSADYALALKLSKEALTKRGKDLQVAAWMTEALVRQEGFAGLEQGLGLISGLLERYWDAVYPSIDEDGDLEMRATPLRWVGSQLDSAIRSVPLTRGKHNWYQYKQSRVVPNEDAARSDTDKNTLRLEAIADGQLTPEEFDKGMESTPVEFVKHLYDTLAGLIENVEALSAFCDERFADASPDFSPLRNSLEDVQTTTRVLFKQKGGTDAPETEDAPVDPWQDAPAAGFEEAAGSAPAAPSEPARRRVSAGAVEPANAEEAVERLLAAARYLRRETPFNDAAYMIPRMLRWGELRAAGGYADPALLTPPASDLRISLKRLASEGAWDQVGELAENAAGQACGRAWLDLQRYAFHACQFTGREAVANAIASGVKSLLADLPQLTQWTLADDTPAANPETVAWMKERSLLPGTEPEVPAPGAMAPVEQPVWFSPPPAASAHQDGAEPAPPDAYALAMRTAQAGNVEEALEILSRELAQEPCGRDRFMRKVQVAQLCLATGNEAIAEPVLQELAGEIDQRNLKEWELADTIAQPLELLYRCLERAPEGATAKRELYARICKLYPARAVRLPR